MKLIILYGVPLLVVLLVGTGILLTIRLHLLQIFKLPKALSLIFRAQNAGSGDIDSFKALCTALSATVGTGNIVGVATAIHAGEWGRFSGCGWRHSSVWRQSMRKVFLLSNIVRLMKR